MGVFKDITGQKFGRLTVLERVENYRTAARWKCICECGEISVVLGTGLRNGHTMSCGCLNSRNYIHGQATRRNATNEYNSWSAMKRRCGLKTTVYWKNYGGRGIKVCDRWLDFNNFYVDMGLRPSKNHSLDRIDVNGDYEPSNCRWATNAEQNQNRRLSIKNTTGHRGVVCDKRSNKWIANISNNNERIYLGTYSDKESAIQARKEAEIKYW